MEAIPPHFCFFSPPFSFGFQVLLQGCCRALLLPERMPRLGLLLP